MSALGTGSVWPQSSFGSHGSDEELFFAEYQGRADSPVPFVGREEELERLSRWLSQADATPYHLLEAPAGRGKTATLVTFAKEVEATGRYDVVFIPVNLRFGLSDYTGFLHRILNRIGEPGSTHEGGTLRTRAERVLARLSAGDRPKLVIIDGLDETLPRAWQFGKDFSFPSYPRPGVRFLLSAREVAMKNWLGELGLQEGTHACRTTLQPISKIKLERALGSMRPSLAGLAETLHRLTDGDPLLLRLYLDYLRDAPEVSSNAEAVLAKWKPGLSYFLDRMLKEPNRTGVNILDSESLATDVLAVLACAHGPVLQSDLHGILRLHHADLTEVELGHTIRCCGRLIIGDCNRLGFSLTHPRLNECIQERLRSRGTLHKTQDVILRFCRCHFEQIRDNTASSSATSRYALHHFRSYLVDAGVPPEEIYALLDERWRNARHFVDSDYEGVLEEVMAVWRIADERGSESRALEVSVQCALLVSSIHSIADALPGPFLAGLVQAGLWSSKIALSHLRCLASSEEMGSALGALVPLLDEMALEDAIELAQSLPWSLFHWPILPLCERLRDRVPELIAEFWKLPLERSCLQMERLIQYLPSNYLSRLVERLERFDDIDNRIILLKESIHHLSGVERSRALGLYKRTISAISAPYHKIKCLLDCAQLSGTDAASMLIDAWEQLQKWSDPGSYPSELLATLCELRGILPQRTQDEIIGEAYRIAQIPELTQGPPHLQNLAITLAKHGRVEEVLHLNQARTKRDLIARLCATVAPHVEPSLRWKLLAQIRQHSISIADRAWALVSFARSQAGENCESIVDEVLQFRIHGGKFLVPTMLLSDIVPLLKPEKLDVVLQRIYAEQHPGMRALNLVSMLDHLNEPSRESVVKSIIELIVGTGDWRVWRWQDRLAAVTPRLTTVQLRDTLPKVIEFSDRNALFETIMEIAAQLGRMDQTAAALGLAEQAAPDKEYGIYARAWLLRHLPQPLRLDLAPEIQQQLQSCRSSGQRLINLIHVLPYLQLSQQSELIRQLFVEIPVYCTGKEHMYFAHLYRTLAEHEGSDAILDEVWAKIDPQSELREGDYLPILAETLKLRHVELALHHSRSPGRVNPAWVQVVRRLAALGNSADALREVRMLEHFEDMKAEALLNILPFVADCERDLILNEISSLTESIDGRQRRAELDALLLPFLSDEERLRSLEALVSRLEGDIGLTEGNSLLTSLVDEIVKLSTRERYGFYSRLLHVIASDTRLRFLVRLRPLIPLLTSLGGVSLLQHTATVIMRIGQRMP